MRSIASISRGGVAALCAGITAAALPAAAAAPLTGSTALSSDCVWRGTSQTRQDPAVQAGLQYAHGSGLSASVWGSNVKYRPDDGAASAFDIAVGWAGQLAPDWAIDAYVLRYQYPGADVPLHWSELNLSLAWRDRAWFAVGHAGNAMASGTTGTYLLAGVRQALHALWRIQANTW